MGRIGSAGELLERVVGGEGTRKRGREDSRERGRVEGGEGGGM